MAGRVSEADHYLHSGTRNYLGTKSVLDVEILEIPMNLEGLAIDGYILKAQGATLR
ncbi:MAG: hypothetical protein R2774_04530 [Saprospiraceae bacterium]